MNDNLSHWVRRLCALAAPLAAFTPWQPAQAGGVHDISLTAIPAARSPITVDGNLSDWPDTHPSVFVPINPGLTASASAELAALRKHPDSVTLQTCYDSKALYIGLVWKGLAHGAGGDSVELHVQTDRIAHFRFTSHVVLERIGDAAAWHPAGGGAKSVIVAHGGRATQEIRIPWSDLTISHADPEKIGLAADFAWPGLTQPLMSRLPTPVLHDNTHLSVSFLTSSAKLFGRDAYLGDPNDWGTLTFAATPHANTTQTSALESGATETFVSPAQTPIMIDGRLNDWKPDQFQTVAYAPGFIGDRYSARIATAYDAHDLYIALHFKSPGGPLNTQAPSTQAGYAGGDCIQIRLNNGKTSDNLCGWLDFSTEKPALTADGGELKNPDLLQQGAKEAFQTDPDGQGYTQEIALPWKALPTGTAPQTGDTWKGTFQFWWSGLNPQFTVLADASLAQGGGIAYSYQLPTEANVALGVYDAQGHLVQTLIKDAHRRAGRNTEYWDGKDQFGNTVAPGRYQVRGIAHPPIGTEHAISIDNPGTPPWPTPDGKGDWLSDEAPAQAAVTDGTNVYLAAPGSEKGHSLIAVGPDGKRIWGYNEAVYPRCVSLALQGDYLYALFSGPETRGKDIVGRAFILCLHKDTGAPARFSTEKTDFPVATWPYTDQVAGLWDLRTNKGFTPANYEGQTRYFANDIGEPTEGVGIAAVGGRLYVSMLTQNQILVLDATTGQQIDTIPIPQPVGLHALPDGRIAGISAGKVVVIDPASKVVTTKIDHNLVAPHNVTTDKAGNFYVSDWGDSFQVKVFSPAGDLLRSIGTKGGRPWIGKWDADGMLLPRGLAVTDDGKLWVTEDDASPSRVSVWDAATGAFIRDYLGPAPYGGGGHFWADPTDPSTVVAQGTMFHVDYAKKTWVPIAVPFRRLSVSEAFTPNGMNGMPGDRTVTHDGKQYVYMTNGSYTLVVFRHDGLLLKPVAAVGSLGRGITRGGGDLNVWDSDIGTHNIPNYYPDFFKGHAGDNYAWSDKNGDGQVQSDEVQWAHSLSRGDKYVAGQLPEAHTDWGFGVGPDGAIYLGGETSDSQVVSRLAVQGWSPSGSPFYDLTAAKPIIAGNFHGGVHGLYVNDRNQIFVTRGYEWNPGKHHALDVYNQDGKLLWSYYAPEDRQQADDFLADNVVSEFHEPGGEDILASWLWHANFKPYLFTADGLYIAALLDDTKLGPTSTWDESYKNYFQAPDGAAYIVDGANDTFHIDRITGLDHLRRFTGTLAVSASALKAAGSAHVFAAPVSQPKPSLHVAWKQTPPAIDGDLTDWDMSSGVALTGSKGRTARIALVRDRDTLYLAYDVYGAKLVNKGGNWQTLFVSGDCDDLMLHTGAYQAHFSPSEGDERLLLSVYQGQPVAVLYRPVVPGSTSPTRLMAATIDQIVRLPSAKIAYKRSGDGYTLEAAVPLSDLGIDPAQADALHGDVGVVYADETGADRSLRLYYYNHDTNMTADLTTEATLQPGNWGDIEFPLGPNLLMNGDFEQPLAAKPEDGWAVTATRNGETASIRDGPVFSGSHTLLLQQTAAVSFTAASYTLPDYGEFINSANGGNGGGYVEVRQSVPVTGGKNYSLRFHLRTLDFPGGEKKDPGPNRGYVSLMAYISWQGPDRKAGGDGQDLTPGSPTLPNRDIWVVNHQDPTPEWATLRDSRFNYYGVPVPYLAPDGAKYATIQFSLVDNFAGRLPMAYVDDVEFVEVP